MIVSMYVYIYVNTFFKTKILEAPNDALCLKYCTLSQISEHWAKLKHRQGRWPNPCSDVYRNMRNFKLSL